MSFYNRNNRGVAVAKDATQTIGSRGVAVVRCGVAVVKPWHSSRKVRGTAVAKTGRGVA